MPTTRPLRAETGRILTLAWPVALTQLQWIVLNVVDTAMVGRASTEELAFFGAGRLVLWVVLIVGIAALSGVQVFAARADGAGDSGACGAVYRQGVLFALALGFGIAVPTFVLARPLLDLFGVPPTLAEGGATVLRAMALGVPAQFLLSAAALFLEGISRPRVAMLVSFLTLPLNVLFNLVLIYGWAGIPAMGAAGAALGTALANLIGALLLVAYVRFMRDGDRYGVAGPWRGAWRHGRALRRFAVAPGLASGFENGGVAVVMAISTTLGAAATGALQILFALHVVSVSLSFGLASAAGVRVGNAVGAGEVDAVARRGWLAGGLSVVSLLLCGLVYIAAGPAMVAAFSDDAEVVRIAQAMVLVMAAFLAFDGLQLVMIFALRAMGDQVAAGVIQVTGFFVVQVGAAWLLVHHLDSGAVGLAWAFAVSLAATALLGCARFAWVTRRRPGSPDRLYAH
jgi:MATE family multidrug resistance protein